MTALVGVFGLALALCGAVVTAGSAFLGGWRGRPVPVARSASWVTLAAIAVCVGAIELALVTHDFSVAFVAANGSRDTPLYYTITSLWAAHDGSLLLWNLVLAAYLAVLATRRPRGAAELHPWAVGVVAVVSAFFLGLALFTGHVFDRVSPVPGDGPGPTPLLGDHPAMGIHPPLLYLGLVGLVVPFGYAVAALVTGSVGPGFVRAISGPLRVAWTALTAGIVLGAWWSYAVLGWGGYWSWDPVENASLMPWLLATGLLHSLVLRRRDGSLASWSLVLAVLAFLLAAVGVVLTRSGAIASVHSFADSGIGPILLGFLVASIAAVLVLAAARTNRGDRPVARSGAPLLTRTTALVVNNVLLAALCLTVLLGTLTPLVVEAFTGQQLSVGPPYYNRMVVPLTALLLAAMAVGPLLPWRRADPAQALRVAAAPVVVGAAVVAGVRLAGSSVGAAVVFGLAAAIVAGLVAQLVGEARRRALPGRRVLAGRLAHLGVAVLIIGVTASSAEAATAERSLRTGESVTVAGTTATLQQVDRGRDARSMHTSAVLRLSGDHADGAVVEPGLRFFTARQQTVAVPAIVSSPAGDVYVSVLSVESDGSGARVRLAVNPLVGWIWAGGGIIVLAGLLGFRLPRRERRRTGVEDRPSEVTNA